VAEAGERYMRVSQQQVARGGGKPLSEVRVAAAAAAAAAAHVECIDDSSDDEEEPHDAAAAAFMRESPRARVDRRMPLQPTDNVLHTVAPAAATGKAADPYDVEADHNLFPVDDWFP
jgi:hypothetical protein